MRLVYVLPGVRALARPVGPLVLVHALENPSYVLTIGPEKVSAVPCRGNAFLIKGLYVARSLVPVDFP